MTNYLLSVPLSGVSIYTEQSTVHGGRAGAGEDGAPELIFRSSTLQGVANFVHIYGVFKQQTNNTNTNKPFQNIKN